jgi:hypothetical protein
MHPALIPVEVRVVPEIATGPFGCIPSHVYLVAIRQQATPYEEQELVPLIDGPQSIEGPVLDGAVPRNTVSRDFEDALLIHPAGLD